MPEHKIVDYEYFKDNLFKFKPGDTVVINNRKYMIAEIKYENAQDELPTIKYSLTQISDYNFCSDYVDFLDGQSNEQEEMSEETRKQFLDLLE